MRAGRKKELTTTSTYDRLMKSKSFRAKMEEEEEKLAVSELILELMEAEGLSVRELAKRANVSTSVIQGLRSGEGSNPTLAVLSRIVHSLGAEIVFRKGKKTLATV